MSIYLDRIIEIMNLGQESSKSELSQAVSLMLLLKGDEHFFGEMLMEGISLLTSNRDDISESEYNTLMSGKAIADFDPFEGIY